MCKSQAVVQIVSKGAGAGEKGCRCAVMPVQVQAGCDCQARPDRGASVECRHNMEPA